MSESFHRLVEDAFATTGILAKAHPHFLPRTGQMDMANAVAQTIVDGGKLVVEAQTGIGKTFAYLIPVLLSGEKALLSTATKNLQDQLFKRDLPFLIDALQLPLRIALLKGRSSYLCLHRLDLVQRESTNKKRKVLWARLETFAQQSESGDLSEFEGLSEHSEVWPQVTSTRENCLGSECPKYRSCFVQLVRKDALNADLVVVNHHLFFADLMVRESGMAELLPSMQVYVFDEAHQLNETGIQFLGEQWGTAQALDLARDTLALGLQQAQGLADWTKLASALEMATRNVRLLFGRVVNSKRLRWVDLAPQGVSTSAWKFELDKVMQELTQLGQGLVALDELGPDFVRLGERVQQQLQTIKRLSQIRKEGSVRWVDVTAQQLRLVESPLEIGEVLQQRLADLEQAPTEPAGRIELANANNPKAMGTVEMVQSKSWIFTSATLGAEDSLQWFTKPCGLEDARTLQVQSPFDYSEQAFLYVPSVFATPKLADEHSVAVAALVAQAAAKLGGHTLVLTTTLRALHTITTALTEDPIFEQAGLELLQQGSASKHELLQRFLQKEGGNCVLVASASFWEGVDIAGDALQLVLIDKLPFPPPNDPLVEARSAKVEAEGGKPFIDYFLPETTIMLQQGAGRLIRTVTDRGVLAVCDPRLLHMGYGKKLLDSLPPMKKLTKQDDFFAVLQRLQQAR